MAHRCEIFSISGHLCRFCCLEHIYLGQPLNRLTRSPVRGNLHVRTIERANGRATEQFKGPFHVGSQDFQGSGYSGLSGGSKPISVCATDQNCASPETEGLDDVAAAPNTAVYQYLGATVDRRDYFRQCL
jgi:hypothetical protein